MVAHDSVPVGGGGTSCAGDTKTSVHIQQIHRHTSTYNFIDTETDRNTQIYIHI